MAGLFENYNPSNQFSLKGHRRQSRQLNVAGVVTREGSEAVFIYPDKWCVYAHYVGSEAIYIGSGKAYRPFDFRTRVDRGRVVTQPRSDDWRLITKDGFLVKILGWYNSKAEAGVVERDLIKKLKPRCNQKYTGRPRHSQAASEALVGNRHLKGHRHSAVARQRMSEAQRAAWTRNPDRRHHRTPVRCVETGEVFETLSAAAKSINRSNGYLSTAIKRNWIIAGGRTYQKIGGDDGRVV